MCLGTDTAAWHEKRTEVWHARVVQARGNEDSNASLGLVIGLGGGGNAGRGMYPDVKHMPGHVEHCSLMVSP